MITLRPYQQAAVDAVYEHLRTREDNPCVVIPTGGGKTPVIATICKDAVAQWGGRVLILAHVKELLEQSADKLRQVCPEVDFGIYSAGLGKRDRRQSVIIAGIQSVFKRAGELGAFDLILVDECHLLPPDGEGMYRQFLADAKIVNPNVRIIGLTATPYRLKSGEICGPKNLLNEVCYEIGVRELIADGFLSPLISKGGAARPDLSGVAIRAGEYVAEQLEAITDTDELVQAACKEIIGYTADRKSVLIFATGVAHGRHIARVLKEDYGQDCGFVCGETPDDQRAELLARFKGESRGMFSGPRLKFLCNVNVLTTGFDAPGVDCVTLLRATKSPGLYYQMVGRGFRLAEGKSNCLVLDFGNNVVEHGPVDQIVVKKKSGNGGGDAPAKECPSCHALIAAGYSICPECGHEFPPPDKTTHGMSATDKGILSGQITDETCEVIDINYYLHHKRGVDDAPAILRVDYTVGFATRHSDFVCFNHTGYARKKAEEWWLLRSRDPIPETSEAALDAVLAGAIATTDEIIVRHIAGERFSKIINYKLGPVPESVESIAGVPMARKLSELELAEIPF